MSTGDNKPGLRDIRSLRERLGMLNKGSGDPAAPNADTGTADRQAAAAHPSDDATATTPESNEPTGPAAPARPASPSSPAAPAGLGSLDVFSKAGQAAETSAPMDVEQSNAAASGMAAFANPLQMGSYAEPSAPVTLSAEDQAELQAYEKRSTGVSGKLLWFVIFVVGGGALVLGYLTSSINKERAFVNANIDATVRAKENIDKAFKLVDEVQTLVKDLKVNEIDFKGTERLPAKLARLDGGTYLFSSFPLSKELTPLIAKFVADSNQLIDEASQHRKLTLFRDKKALAAIVDGLGPLNGKPLVFRAMPPQPNRGPQVELVGIMDQNPILKKRPIAGGGKKRKKQFEEVRFFKIVDKSGKIHEVQGDTLLTIDKSHLFVDGQANVLTLYQQRVRRLQTFASEIDKYEQHFKKILSEQAKREKISTFF